MTRVIQCEQHSENVHSWHGMLASYELNFVIDAGGLFLCLKFE